MFKKLLEKLDNFLKKSAEKKPCCCGKCKCANKDKKEENKKA